ncbi:MAG: hypothetical protein M1418_03755 [Deltaproteobacteria bacterium]|nr:hypothetical protein [Deltaproteobacteria bacterium]
MGRDRIVSIVPFSYSRAMTREVSIAPTIIMMIAMIPGMMKFRLSRSSLNQTRILASTGGRIFSIPWRLRNSVRMFRLVLSMKPLMYARAIPAKFGSLPSRRIWMTASRSALRSAVQPAGMITASVARPWSSASVTAAVSGRWAVIRK